MMTLTLDNGDKYKLQEILYRQFILTGEEGRDNNFTYQEILVPPLRDWEGKEMPMTGRTPNFTYNAIIINHKFYIPIKIKEE